MSQICHYFDYLYDTIGAQTHATTAKLVKSGLEVTGILAGPVVYNFTSPAGLWNKESQVKAWFKPVV